MRKLTRILLQYDIYYLYYCLVFFDYLLVSMRFKSRGPPASSLCCGRGRKLSYSIHGGHRSSSFSRQFNAGFPQGGDFVIRRKVQTQADFVFELV